MIGRKWPTPNVIESTAEAYRETLPQAPEWGEIIIVGAVVIALALMLHWISFAILRRLTRETADNTDNVLVKKLSKPVCVAVVVVALAYMAQFYPILSEWWEKIGGMVMPLLVGWLAWAILRAFIAALYFKADISVADNLRARRRRTRLAIFARLATFLIIFVTVGLMMLAIPGVRDIGVTLVASAGLAGLAVGAAAQPALRSLIAGSQMALTEPINIDDVVIIEGEWGRIEDIRTTYVLVKIWDERRLVVPTTYFLEKPFQNWTKKTSDLLGTVMLYLDPAAGVDPLRAEFERLIESHPLWDGRVQKLQVTETSAEAKEVRLLMSAKDASALFDLRCDVREDLLGWLSENQPAAFVRTRIENSGCSEEFRSVSQT